jgi:hypothetical protein
VCRRDTQALQLAQISWHLKLMKEVSLTDKVYVLKCKLMGRTLWCAIKEEEEKKINNSIG